MPRLPVPVELEVLLKRLTLEEAQISLALARLEEELRQFEDFVRPAYDHWIRIELGPRLFTLELIFEKIRERQILARRIIELQQSGEFTPREAHYLALGHDSDSAEVTARRRAKLETKRTARREEKKRAKDERKNLSPSIFKGIFENDKTQMNPRRRLISLYRILARQLHPDSPLALKTLPNPRLLKLWHEVQSAYHSANYERLVAIAAWLGGNSPTPFANALGLSERFERIRSMERSCFRLKKQLSELGTHPGWNFLAANAPLKRKLLQKAAHDLEAETARAQQALESLKDFFKTIGSPKAPKLQGRKR